MSVDPEVIRKSVTASDFPKYEGGGVFHFLIPTWAPHAAVYAMPPDLPPYWSRQVDWILRATPYLETSFWAGALSIAISKMSAMAWEVQGASGLRVRKTQELILRADGAAGWVRFLSKHLRDYLTTCNGSFIEIVRQTRAYGSKIIGLKHLDSCRATRTGDPEIPVVYRDRIGREHEMKRHQVIMMSDMEDSSETYYGIGMPAAYRCYREIYKMAAIQRYVAEKVAGNRALALHLVTGLSDRSLQSALTAAQQQNAQRGTQVYMGAVVVPMLGDVPATLVTIPLAELPDGFDRETEYNIAMQSYANAIGLDIQDIKPLTGKMAGTAAQAKVMDDKETGKGLSAWRQQFTHHVNEWVAPDETTFFFRENDFRDQLAAAQISMARTTSAVGKIQAGIISPPQALQVLVDQDELPREFLAQDMTQGSTLSDTEKPVSAEVTGTAAEQVSQVGQTAPSQGSAQMGALDKGTPQTASAAPQGQGQPQGQPQNGNGKQPEEPPSMVEEVLGQIYEARGLGPKEKRAKKKELEAVLNQAAWQSLARVPGAPTLLDIQRGIMGLEALELSADEAEAETENDDAADHVEGESA